jgi:hypothetical protein
MTLPLCFGCKHFRQYQPLTFLQPGECRWDAVTPAWLEPYVWSDDYYAPKRAVWSRGGNLIEACGTFEAKELNDTV